MKKGSCPTTPSELYRYLESKGVAFVLLSDEITELGPNVAAVTEAIYWDGSRPGERVDDAERHRAKEIDEVIQESVRRITLRDDVSCTVFWYVQGSDEAQMEHHPEDDPRECMKQILDFVRHDLGFSVLARWPAASG